MPKARKAPQTTGSAETSSTGSPFTQKRSALVRARNSWEATRNHWVASCRALREASPMDEGYAALIANANQASESYVTASAAFLRACEKI